MVIRVPQQEAIPSWLGLARPSAQPLAQRPQSLYVPPCGDGGVTPGHDARG
jgi:hypothetical protein